MNNVQQLIQTFKAKDIQVEVQTDGKLHINAPKGVLTPEIKQSIKTHKLELIEALNLSDHSTHDNKRYSLKPEQQQLWQQYQQHPDNSSQNICYAVHLKYAIDNQKLQHLWSQLLQQHPILRSNIAVNQDQAALQVEPHLDKHFFYEEHIDLDSEGYKVEAEVLAQKVVAQTFALDRESLVRLHLIRYNEQAYTVVISCHRLICDEHSLLQILGLLLHSYQRLTHNKSIEIKAQHNYFDAHQQQLAELPALIESTKSSLSNANQHNLHLVNISRLQSRATKKLRSHFFELDSQLYQNLSDFSQAHAISLENILFCAYLILLSKYSAQNDYSMTRVINSTSYVIGPMSHDEYFHCHIDQQQRFIDFLKHQSNDNRERVSFSALTQAGLLKPAEPSIAFEFKTKDQLHRLQTLNQQVMRGTSDYARFDLHICLDETLSDSLYCKIDYNEELFNHTDIVASEHNVELLLKQLVNTQGQQSIQSINYIHDKEKQSQLFDWNDTQTTLPKHFVIEAFDRQSKLTPNAIALQQGNRSMSYSALHQQSQQLGKALQEKITPRTKAIGIALDNNIDLVCCLLGVLNNNIAYIPLNAHDSIVSHQMAASQLSLDFVICSQQQPVLLTSTQTLFIEDLLNTSAKNELVKHSIIPDAPMFYVQDELDIVGISHLSFNNLMQWFTQTLSIGHQDKLLLSDPAHLNSSQKVIFSSICSGAQLVLPESPISTYQHTAQLIADHAVTIVNCHPNLIQGAINDASFWSQLSSLRWLILKEATTHYPIYIQWINNSSGQHSVMQTFEQAICSGVCSYHLINEQTQSVYSNIGKPIDNCQIYILDEQQQACAIKARGKIYISGEVIGLGYLNPQTDGSAPLVDNPFDHSSQLFNTQSFGARNHQGEILLLSQLNIEPGLLETIQHIEHECLQHPKVAQCIVKHEKDVLHVYALAKQEQTLEESELKLRLNVKLNESQVLSEKSIQFHCREILHIDALGQIIDAANIADNKQQALSATQTTTQKLMSVIWSKVLERSDITSQSNFFSFGGDSLKAAEVNQALEQQLNIQIPTNAMFDHSSLEAFSAYVDQHINQFTPTPNIEQTPENAATTSFEAISNKDKNTFPLSLEQQHVLDLEKQYPNQAFYSKALFQFAPLEIPELTNRLDAWCQMHPMLGVHFNVEQTLQAASNERIEIDFVSLQSDDIATLKQLHEQQVLAKDSQALSHATAYIHQHSVSHLSMLVHHAICDHLHFQSAVCDLIALLNKPDSSSAQETLINSAPRYFDYIQQQKALSEDKKTQQLEYWKNRLVKIPAPSPLAQSNQAEANKSNYLSTEFFIEADIYSALTNYCHENDLTLFMALIACYQVFLSQHSQQSDICIAVPSAIGNAQPFEKLAGNFNNTLLIRLQSEKNPTAAQLFADTKQAVLGAINHQNIFFQEIIEALKLTNADSFSFCRAALSLNQPNTEITQAISQASKRQQLLCMSGLMIQPDIFLNFCEKGTQLQGTFYTPENMFSQSCLDDYAAHFNQILSEMISNDSLPVKNINCFSQTQLTNLLELDTDNIERIAPLSNMQRDIFFDSQLNPNQTWNFFGQTVVLPKDIDNDIFQQAIQVTIDLEPNLRTIYKSSPVSFSDIGYRCILPAGDPRTESKITFQEHQGDQQSLQRFARDLIYQPYDLQNKIPVRNHLVRHNEQDWVWVTCVHHIVCDGLGMHLWLLKVLDNYQRIIKQETPEPMPFSFDDYYKQNRLVADSKNTIEYWLNAVDNADPLSNSSHLADRSVPAQEIERNFSLSDEHSARIRRYCFQHRTTAATYTKSILTILLKAYFNQRERGLIFNEVRVGRNLENGLLIGCCFTNQPFIVPAKAIDGNRAFSELLQFTSQYQKDVEPFEFISNSQIARFSKQSDLQFSFNFYGSVPPLKIFDHTCEIIENIPRLDNAIHCVARMADKRLQFNLLFNSGQWNDNRFLERFEHISQQILDGEETLKNLTLLLPDETIKLQGKLAPYQHRNLAQWLTEASQEYLNHPAVIHRDQSLTYQQLHQASNQLAHYLISQEHSHQSKIALCLPSCIDFMIGLLAIIKSGNVYIPIDPQYPVERISYIINDANIDCVITQKDLIPQLGVDESICIFLDESEHSFYQQQSQFPMTETPIAVDLESMLYVIYTSGSTGKPKGTAVKIRGEINLLQWYCKEFDFAENERTLIISASGFDLTQKNFFAPLLTGGCVVFPDVHHYDAEHYLQLIHQHKINLMNCAPSAFYPLVDHKKHWSKLTSLRLVLFGGESIRMKQLIDWLNDDASQAQIINMYGPTECTDIASFYRIESPQEYLGKNIPIGKANDNVRLYIVDSDLRQLPTGIPGELVIGGESVGLGYLNQSEQNKTRFINNPFAKGNVYRTGDLVKLNNDDNIVFLNRLDFQLKIRGLRIEAGEIEFAIRSLEHVDDALVSVRDETLIAYAVIEPEQMIADNWRTQLQNKLPMHMIPQHLISLEQWPLTPNGKIDRQALPQPSFERELVEPRNALERQLHNIWSDVLKADVISIHDNFFDLGGHSLLAAQMISRMREQLDINFDLRELFEATTIAEIANIIEHSDASTYAKLNPIVPVNREQALSLSYGQEQLWLVEQLHLGISAYNMPVAVRIRGQFSRQAFEAAIQAVCQRHEILRTTFISDDSDSPRQVIHENIAKNIISYKQSLGLTEQERVAHANKQSTKEVNTPFELDQLPLFRIKLFEYDKEDFLLLMTMHHIISDGWSIGILLQEASAYYQQALDKTSHDVATSDTEKSHELLPPLSIQYADYAAWQRQWLEQEGEQHLDYWVNQLSDAPQVLKLPTDYPRPKQQTFNGKLFEFEMSAELKQNINQFAAKRQATPFMVLLAGYGLLLSRYAKQQDVIIGIPSAGRSHVETEALIGYFVNPLVMRLQLSDQQSIEDYLEHVKSTVFDGLSHQYIPAEMIVQELKISRNPSYPPIAQVGFALQNLPGVSDTRENNLFSGLDANIVKPENQISKYDLSLFVFDDGDTLKGAFEYNTDLFHENTITRFTEQLELIYQSFCQQPENTLNSIELFNRQDLMRLLALKPEDTQNIYPLPPTVRDFYLNALIYPDTLSNSTGVCHYVENESYDFAQCQQAWQTIVDHFSILRSKIVTSDKTYLDVAYLQVSNECQAPLEYQDLSKQQWDRTTFFKYAEEQCYKSYKLASDPLIKIELIKLGHQQYGFIAYMNHILFDGVCGRILLEAFGKQIKDPQNNVLPEDNIEQYIQFANQQYDQTETIDYWSTALHDCEPIYKEHASSDQVKSLEYTFDADLSKQIKMHCFKQRITPVIFFKAIYGLLIAHYYRCTSDFIIRDTGHGRNKEFANTIICTAESPPMVFPQSALMDNIASRDALYQALKDNHESAKAHSMISLQKQKTIIDSSGLQFIFNFLAYAASINEDINLFTPLDIENTVQLQVIPDECFTLLLRFNESNFVSRHFLERFEAIAQQLMHDDLALSDLNFILEHEHRIIPRLSLPKDDKHKNFTSLLDGFEQHAESHPQDIALAFEQQNVTYGELNERANQLAHYLQSLNVQADERVAIFLDRSIEMIVAILATQKAQTCYLPLDPHSPSERVHFILDDANARFMISKTAHTQDISLTAQQQLIAIDTLGDTLEQQPTDNLGLKRDPTAPSYVIYTSGTTGKPKGCMVSLHNTLRLFTHTHSLFNFNDQDVWTLYHSYAFDFSVWEIWGALFYGGKLVIVPYEVSRSPQQFLNLLQQQKVTVLNQTPSAFKQLAEEVEAVDFTPSKLHLRYIVFGGEALDPPSLTPWASRFGLDDPQLINMYGITETTVHSSFHRVQENDLLATSSVIGYALPDLDLELVDQHLRPVATGFNGEIIVKGDGVTLGYLDRPDLNKQKFVEHLGKRAYRSGDLARQLDNGALEYLGRIDQQIKIRGHRLELGEIEHELMQIDGVDEALTLARKDKTESQQLVAYFSGNTKLSSDELRKQLSESLPDYMIPSFFVALDKWPLTGNGKIDRKALPEPQASQTDYQAPRSELETHLVAIWEDVLDVHPIGIYDNFFSLGGHSLLAVKLAKRIENEIGFNVPITSLFNAQDVASLASVLSGETPTQSSCLLPLRTGELGQPPLFIVHPFSGLAIVFSELAKAMTNKHPLVGIQAYGFAGETASTSIEQAAERYVKAIQAVQPEGPYYLAGYSLGGAISFEMARQLKQAGHEVAFLCMIDGNSEFKWFSQRMDDARMLHEFIQLVEPDSTISYRQLKRIKQEDRVDWIKQQHQESKNLIDLIQPAEHVLKGVKQMMDSYQAEALDINVTFISAESRVKNKLAKVFQWKQKQSQPLGWEKFVTGELRHAITPGDHNTIMQPPNVGSLAKIIDRALEYEEERRENTERW